MGEGYLPFLVPEDPPFLKVNVLGDFPALYGNMYIAITGWLAVLTVIHDRTTFMFPKFACSISLRLHIGRQPIGCNAQTSCWTLPMLEFDIRLALPSLS